MPEGHTIHRLAADHLMTFGGRPVRASSPQGRFDSGAKALDGRVLDASQAHGKHLFLGFTPFSEPSVFAPPIAAGRTPEPGDRPGPDWLHIHLGLYGTFAFGDGEPPAPVGAVRLRLEGDAAYADLRGPATCELLTEEGKDALHARLGQDPLRPCDDGGPAWSRISRSRTSVAVLLMDQKIVAGVGNVYRAEVLFRHGIDPERMGRDLRREEWDAVWADLVALMGEGVRLNRIDTVRPEHTPEAMGRPPRVDDHGGEVYVYRRAGQPCLVCGTEIRTRSLAARNLFWCPTCQKR